MRRRLAPPLLLAIGFLPLLLAFATDFNELVLRHWRSADTADDFVYWPQQIVAEPEWLGSDLVIVGGSSVREFFPGGLETSRAFSRLCGRKVSALNAGTSSQNLADSIAIIDALWERGARPKTIIVGSTPYRLANAWTSWDRLAAAQQMTLPVAGTLIANLNPSSRLGAWLGDKGGQIARLNSLLKTGSFKSEPVSFPIEERQYYNVAPLPPVDKQMNTLIAASATGRGLDHAAASASRFVDTFSVYRERGVKIIFLFTPVSNASYPLMSQGQNLVEDAKDILARGGDVLDLRRDHALPEDVFYDEQHLRPEGRAMLWDKGLVDPKFLSAVCTSL